MACLGYRPGLITLKAQGDVGWYTSIVLGTDGQGLIGYEDETSGALKVAHCVNFECSSAATATASA